MAKLRAQILNRLKEERDYVHSGSLERMEFPHDKKGKYKPSTVARVLREITETDERVEKKYENNSVLYRYKLSVYEKFHQEQLL